MWVVRVIIGAAPPPSRLGLAYAGSSREDVIEVLTPVMEDSNSSFEVSQWLALVHKTRAKMMSCKSLLVLNRTIFRLRFSFSKKNLRRTKFLFNTFGIS